MNDLPSLIAAVADRPVALALLLFAATFVAEDLATIAAGIAVAQFDASPAAALTGVILGTAFGDLALYGVGRWGAATAYGTRLRQRQDVGRAERWVAARALWMVFAARFLPGFRLPVFTASGLVKAPLLPVAALIALTTPVWTAALFESARMAGAAGAEAVAGTFLPLAAVVLLAGHFVRLRASPQ